MKYPLYKRIIKILLWTAFGIVLAIVATIICALSLLTPERLTPIVNNFANEYLEAEVTIGRVELTAKSTYPFVRLQVDSVTIVSDKISAVKHNSALGLPEYADTLLTLDRFIGEINLPALMAGKIKINDVLFDGPAINVVFVNDSLSNMDIFQTTEAEETTEQSVLPEIEVRRFTLQNPGPIRYFNAADSTSAECRIEVLMQKNDQQPLYRLDFSGNVHSDLLADFNRIDLPFMLNGDIFWKFSEPYNVKVDNLTTALAFVSATASVDVDFADAVKINSLKAHLNPLRVDSLLTLVPDSLYKAYGLKALKTDAEFSMDFKLDSVFDLQRDTIPYASIALDLPECKLTYGKARMEKLAMSLRMALKGNDLNAAEVMLENLFVEGPATRLQISANVSRMLEDPQFDARIDGFTNLSKLPPPLLKMIDGSLSGKVKAAISVSGTPSMFDRNKFHLLRADGDIDVSNLYWLAGDTANMIFVNDGCLKFGTHRRKAGLNLLSASVEMDSIDILTGGISMNATDLSLGVGVENMKPTRDTTVVLPLGGGLKMKTFNLSSFSDSTALRIRNVDGKVIMRRYNNQARIPEFIFDLGIRRMAAGMPDARVMFSKSKLHFSAHKLPEKESDKALRKIADSIRVSHPDISVDSVYVLALERSRRNRRQGHRVHAEMTDSSSELIDWGTSKFLDKLLLKWKIEGSLNSEKARLFTPHFPLRNRLDNLNIAFDNDSLVFRNVAYKVGHSDFLTSGRITNLKRGLTAKRRVSPIGFQIETLSDTVDVNQLAEAFFKGAAYSSSGKRQDFDLNDVDNDDSFDAAINRETSEDTDSMGPVLIPLNVEADIMVKAKNILYSDLVLHDLTGDLMIFDGALNLHRLRATSDAGSVDLSALYSAPDVNDMKFGFGLNVKRFDISRFMDMVPALDTIMPLLRDMDGIINADIAATVDVNRNMDFELPTLAAAIKLQGDSLQLLDAETFRTIAKWLMFKNKQRNIIDHMNVEMVISDNEMQLFPFIFDIDRYKLGIQGHNDLALNFNYLISVLKSPLPFKFGITIKGNPDDYKIRVGKAKFNEKQAIERKLIVDTARINLIDQIENVFKKGVRNSKFAKLNIDKTAASAADINLDENPVSAEDSLMFIREGLIPAPVLPDSTAAVETSKSKKKKK